MKYYIFINAMIFSLIFFVAIIIGNYFNTDYNDYDIIVLYIIAFLSGLYPAWLFANDKKRDPTKTELRKYILLSSLAFVVIRILATEFFVIIFTKGIQAAINNIYITVTKYIVQYIAFSVIPFCFFCLMIYLSFLGGCRLFLEYFRFK